MNIFNIWWVNVIAFLLVTVVFNQSYKIVTKTSSKDGALTILLQLLTGITTLLLFPFFEIKFPTDLRVYLFLGLAIIFYAINNRLNTPVRREIQASKISILGQVYTIFMIIIGLIIFREPFVITKIIGAVLIIFSNLLVFYKKGELKIDKYVVFGVLANLSMAIAVSFDISVSENFNLPIYVAITFMIPSILIFLFERPKISDIQSEFKNGNKVAILITAISWSLSAVTSLRAYLLGDVTTVAPLCALNVILNVFAGYIFLKERDNLSKKIIAGILIIISVILIQI